MRLLCPFCQKPITVADSEAGKAVNCPECGQQFAAPQLFTPSAAAAPASSAPPPPVPETYTPDPRDRMVATDLPDLPAPDREMSGFQRMASLPLDPRVIRWVPAAALTLVLLLTFFKWNGMYPAGYGAYTQNAWQSLFGGLSVDPVAEDEFKLKTDLEERIKTNWWLLPYLLFLIPALLLAWAGPVVDMAKIKLPEGLEKVWQLRPAILGAILAVTFLFLLVQWASGFGVQRAVYDKVEADSAKAKAMANTPDKEQRYEMNLAMAKGASQVKTTPWLRFAALAHLIAILAVAAEVGLTLRGHKPPPRVAAMW
jgi:hypothetical protein